MSRPSLHFASRALRKELLSPLFWSACSAAALILAVSGPFGTVETIPSFVARLGYWLFAVFATYLLGFMATMTLQPMVERRHFVLRAAVQGVAVGALVTPTIIVANWLVLDVTYPSLGATLSFAGVMMLICLSVTAVMISTLPLRARLEHAATTTPAETQARSPALVARLPIGKRGDLVAISSEDHHVRIQTTLGEHWLRMRLVDAIAAAEPTEGLQVHRSHWVATAAITDVARDGKGATLTLTHGPQVPVSRGHMGQVRAAGLLG